MFNAITIKLQMTGGPINLSTYGQYFISFEEVHSWIDKLRKELIADDFYVFDYTVTLADGDQWAGEYILDSLAEKFLDNLFADINSSIKGKSSSEASFASDFFYRVTSFLDGIETHKLQAGDYEYTLPILFSKVSFQTCLDSFTQGAMFNLNLLDQGFLKFFKSHHRFVTIMQNHNPVCLVKATGDRAAA